VTNNATTLATLDPNSRTTSGFLFFSDLKTQHQAEAHCKLNGGHLAYFNNAAEQNNIEQWLVTEVRVARLACPALCRNPTPLHPCSIMLAFNRTALMSQHASS
jgi:hypothetical protein